MAEQPINPTDAHESAGVPPPASDLTSSGPKKSSVGIHSITESARYSMAEMGPKRSLQTLLTMNHVDGFDCPSCAWGDPDPDHRKIAEFCENGAKAVAWEATRKRVDAAFFAEHSVAALRERDGPCDRLAGLVDEAADVPAAHVEQHGDNEQAVFARYHGRP